MDESSTRDHPHDKIRPDTPPSDPAERNLSPTGVAEAERLIVGAWRDGYRVRFDGSRDTGEARRLSLAGLDRITTLNVEDGVAVVEAGVRISAIRDAAEAVGLWCPALRHLPAGEPIGAAAAGGHGWRSRGYGGLADSLLGSCFVCPSVGLVRHGGTAIKNATGYNLTALLAGSRGSFGIILSLNLRLVPLPRERASRGYCIPASKVAAVSTALAGIGSHQSSYRFDADSVLARIQPETSDAEILVEVSDASRAGLDVRVDRLDAEARRLGAHPSVEANWSVNPAGKRLRLSTPPRETPARVANLLETLGPSCQGLRFEATGGGIDVWVSEVNPETASLFAPSNASSRLREAFRRAFDPDGLLGE